MTRPSPIRRAGLAAAWLCVASSCGGIPEPDGSPPATLAPEITRVEQPSINGADDRVNISAAPAAAKELAKGILSVHYRGNVVQNTDGTYKLLSTGPVGLCSGERFASEIPRAQCSAFLIAPDLVATAKHCIRGYTAIDVVRFVWGFHDSSGLGPDFTKVPAANVFTPVEVVYEPASSLDVIVLRVDHPAPGFTKPFRISPTNIETATVPPKIPVTAMGFPLGLPMKYAPNGFIQNATWRFDTSLDIQSGNSGSAIFDAATFDVYGVLTSGADDVVHDAVGQCGRYYRCPPQYTYCREIGDNAFGMRAHVQPAGTALDAYDLYGKFAVGAPATASASDGKEYVVITSDDGKLYWRSKSSSAAPFTAWQEVPGNGRSLSAPAVTESRSLLYVLSRGSDNQLYYTSLNLTNGAWAGAWTLVPAPPSTQFWPPYEVADAPTAFSLRTVQSWNNFTTDSLVMMVRASSGRVFSKTFSVQTASNGSVTQGWGDWGLIWTGVSNPPRVAMPGEKVFVFARTTAGTVQRRTFYNCPTSPAGCWDGTTVNVDAPVTRSEPGAISFGNGTYWLLVRGADDQIYKRDGDAAGAYSGSWTALYPGGRTFAGPTGTRAWGTWWLYTAGADKRIYRY